MSLPFVGVGALPSLGALECLQLAPPRSTDHADQKDQRRYRFLEGGWVCELEDKVPAPVSLTSGGGTGPAWCSISRSCW